MATPIQEKRPLCYFSPLPRGKPNQKEPRPPYPLDNRSRVPIAAMKGHSAMTSALKLIAPRFNAPNMQSSPDRYFERLSSQKRKEQGGLDWMLSVLLGTDKKSILEQATKQKLQDTSFRSTLEGLHLEDPFGKPVGVVLANEIGGFESQNESDNLYDYMLSKIFKHREQVNINYLQSLGVDIIEAYDAFCEQYGDLILTLTGSENPPAYHDLPTKIRCVVAEGLARAEYIKHAHIEPSDWKPSDPLENLIQELKLNGPIVVAGEFGSHYYKTEPKAIGKIGARTIYGWGSKDRSKESRAIGHACVIVGAQREKNGEEVVYYIDPKDGSDPKNPEQQRIYAMSYNRLTNPSSLANVYGIACDLDVGLPYAYRREALDYKLIKES